MTHSSHFTQLAPQSTTALLTASLRAVCSAVRANSTYASEGPCELLKSRLTVGATQRVSIPAMPHRTGRSLHLRPQTIAAAYVTLRPKCGQPEPQALTYLRAGGLQRTAKQQDQAQSLQDIPTGSLALEYQRPEINTAGH